MAYKLRAVTLTKSIGDDEGMTRYLYVDKATGKTMTLLEPLYPTDDVAGVMKAEPSREHITTRGIIKIVTTWSRP